MEYLQALKIYKEKFDTEPRVFRSPGRINIIGEHTDYNEGLVFPVGIDKEICMVMGANGSDQSCFYSLDNQEEISFSRSDVAQVPEGWARYIAGVYDQLYRQGVAPGGVDAVFSGDIPVGAGLSSSAALECVTLFGLNALFDLNIEKQQMPQIAQKAENEFVGVHCGIMDQFASIYAEQKQALLLDCRDLSYTYFDLDMHDHQLLLVDTLVKHDLLASEYNKRREECMAGVAFFQQKRPEVRTLRDVTLSDFHDHGDELSPLLFRRCKYVVDEIRRVQFAGEALSHKDFAALGNLLYASHRGMQFEFEISCKELNFLVDFTRDKSYVLGARMMGGGFGGCTLNIVASDQIERFKEEVKTAYQREFDIVPEVYSITSASGTSELQLG